MTGRVTVLTPKCESDAIELGRSVWRKQILPIGKLPYRDRVLNFTRDYLQNIVSAFQNQAYDTVPLQLAGEDGGHNNAPERATGEIIGLEATDDGLFATVATTDKADEILRANPKLPVSVRVVEDYERNDGKSTQRYSAALQHVLLTATPRVAGMSPWQLVECAQETDEVIDLSALTFTSDGAVKETPPSQEKAANGGSTEKEEGTRVPEITDEQAAAFLKKLTPAMLVELLNKPEAAPQSPDDQKPTDEDKAEDKPIAPVVQLPTAPPAPVAVAASQVDEGKHIDLAQVEMATRVDQLTIQLAQVEAREAAARWENESQSLVRDFGVPPAVVAQVEPLLKGGKHLIELSDGTSVNAGDVVRGVLHTIAKTWGKAVDLSGPIGSAHEAEMDTAAAERKRIHEIARASGVGR